MQRMTHRSESARVSPALADLIACPGCDLLHHRRSLRPGQRAHCLRCGDVIQTSRTHTIERSLSAVLASIVLLLVSLSLPFLSLSRTGVSSSMSVLDAVKVLWVSNMQALGLAALSFIVLLPLLRYSLLGWVLWRIYFKKEIIASMRTAFRWSLRLEPWAMADIFMVGVVVALVKISTLASLQMGLAFWSLLMLVGLTVFIHLNLCKDTIWARLTHQA